MNIINGKEQITIRPGHRDYRPEPVMLCCHLEPWCVMAHISAVRICMLSDVTQEEYKTAGYVSFDHLAAHMQELYPEARRTV